MGNYRPISVIPHFIKILEKSVKYQLMAYLTKHRLLTGYQMAYMKGRSTQRAMNYISNKFLSNINNGLYTCACLIDLSKCFDCVHNELLLQKLTHYVIFNVEHNWFKSYLPVHNRQQIVTFNNGTSSVKNIDIGVPKAPFLAQFYSLFLLMICLIFYQMILV